MVTTTLKHENLREQLLETISTLPNGSRMPTVRNIMYRYNVSQSTVDKALRYLKEGGHIEAAPGRGIIVKTQQTLQEKATLKNVDFVFFGYQSPAGMQTFHGELIEQLTCVLGEKEAWLRNTVLPHRASTSQIVSHIDNLKSDGVILANLYNREVFDIIKRRNISFVMVTPNCPTELPNSILVENRSVARNWIKHLVGLGHRTIAYLHGAIEEYYQHSHYQRLQFYYEELGRAGIAPDPDIVICAGFTREDGYKAAKKLLKTGKEFTAIICGDGNASGIYEALQEKGIVIGKDVSVIGVDDSSWASHMHPPLTTVRIPRRRLAELAVGKLEELIQSPEKTFERTYIESELVVRQSTGVPVID